MEYIPKVLQAVAGEDFTIYLYFSDGSVRLYDAKPLLQLGGVFEPMRDPDYFRDRLTVRILPAEGAAEHCAQL